VTWLLANSPMETIVLKPTPQQPATPRSPNGTPGLARARRPLLSRAASACGRVASAK
jgi:hypothetical protein